MNWLKFYSFCRVLVLTGRKMHIYSITQRYYGYKLKGIELILEWKNNLDILETGIKSNVALLLIFSDS